VNLTRVCHEQRPVRIKTQLPITQLAHRNNLQNPERTAAKRKGTRTRWYASRPFCANLHRQPSSVQSRIEFLPRLLAGYVLCSSVRYYERQPISVGRKNANTSGRGRSQCRRHIFERFFRVEKGRTRTEDGAGLGWLSPVGSLAHTTATSSWSMAMFRAQNLSFGFPLQTVSESLDTPCAYLTNVYL
jgi:hypothetical protein